MNKVICVYSSSSDALDPVYFKVAAEVGEKIARNKDILLFGGGLIGLMGATARAVHEHRGKVIGVIPKALNLKEVVYDSCDELIVTEDLRTRKATMDARSDAFIALPGGYGTLEEILEIITLKQLNYHHKPIVLLNVNNFYHCLIQQFDSLIAQKFARPDCRELYRIASAVDEALNYIDRYRPAQIKEKWL